MTLKVTDNSTVGYPSDSWASSLLHVAKLYFWVFTFLVFFSRAGHVPERHVYHFCFWVRACPLDIYQVDQKWYPF